MVVYPAVRIHGGPYRTSLGSEFAAESRNMRAIVIRNLKGGCGKTTTAVNLAAALVQMDERVLIIDLDPQAHATLTLGHDPEAMDKTIYHF